MKNTNRFYRALPSGLGDWVYGSVVDNGKDRCYIIQKHINQRIPVIQETIGQYVPCLDAFEGDILYGYDRDSQSPRPKWYGTVTYMPDHSRIMVVTAGPHYYEVDEFPFNSPTPHFNIHQHEQHFRRELISVEMVKYIMANRDVIMSHETAALLLGLATPKRQSTLHCYTNADYNIPGVVSHNVDSLDSIHHLSILGVRITNDDQTDREHRLRDTSLIIH